MSMKNSNDAIGNRTCDLPACSAEPAPPRAPFYIVRVEVQEFTARLILSFKKKKYLSACTGLSNVTCLRAF